MVSQIMLIIEQILICVRNITCNLPTGASLPLRRDHSHVTESGIYAVLSVCLAKLLVCHAIVQFVRFRL